MDGHRKDEIALDKLLVNPENYRFDPVTDQQQAILTMLHEQNNKILRLARHIAEHGLNPTKRLLVKETKGKYVVLEGNRRITVLKLMTNPNEIPEDYLFKSIFQGLHAKYKDRLPRTIECVVYPEDQQGVADGWVLLEHTGANQGMGTVSWDSAQRGRFEARHKQQELSRALQIIDFLENNDIDTSRVEATSLKRIIETRGVPQMLGINFPKRKKFILVEPQEEVLQRLKKLVDAMSADDFNVGKIYTLTQRTEWVQNVLAPQPTAPSPSEDAETPAPVALNGKESTPSPQPSPSPASSNGTTTAQSATPRAATTTLAPQTLASTPTPTPTRVPFTLVDDTKQLPPTTPDKIKSIYRELQIVNITGKYAAPHAVGALLRILIEITAEEYLMMKQGFRFDSGGFFRNPAEQGKAYERLDEKLKYIANKCNLPGNVANVLRVLISDQIVITTLNQVMHNTLFKASSTAIKELWQNFEKVFEYLINEMK